MAGWKFYLNGTEVEEPIGWDGIEFTASRSENHGIDQPFSTAVQFYGKGAHILKEAFDANFVTADVAFLITSTDAIYGQPYQYLGIVDFATYEEINSCDTDSWSVSVGILQDTFRDKFKSRYDLEVDLFKNEDVDGNAIPHYASIRRFLRLHSQSIELLGNGGSLAVRNTEVRNQNYDGPDPPPGYYNDGWFDYWAGTNIPIYWDTSDFTGMFGTTYDCGDPRVQSSAVVFVHNNGVNSNRTLTLNWNAFSVQYKFDYSTAYTQPIPLPDQSMNLQLDLRIWDSSGNIVSNHSVAVSNQLSFYECSGCPPQPWINWNIPSGSYTFTIAPNQRVSFKLSWGSLGSIKYDGTLLYSNEVVKASVVIPSGVVVRLREANKSNASSAAAIPIIRFLRRIIHQITGNANGIVSDCFDEIGDGVYANNCITTGLLLRNWNPQNGQTIQVRTSFKKVFESLCAIFGVGWAYEKQANGTYKIRVEPYEYFYQNIIQFTFNDVEQLKKTAVADKLYGQLKFGYNDNWKNMALGGIDAVCTDRNYAVLNNSVNYGSTSTLELKSDIIGEGIAIEYSRRLQFFDDNAGSSDRPNDYQLFIIWTVRKAYTVDLNTNPEYGFQGESGTITLNKYGASWAANFDNNVLPSRWGDDLKRYNLFHTSARVAIRQWAWAGMNVFGLTDQTFRFQVGQYRTKWSSAVNSFSQPNVIEDTSDITDYVLLSEDTNINEAILKPLFKQYLLKPIIFEFEYPQAFCDFIELANYTPYQKVRVTIGSVKVSGWILEIKNKPEDNSGGTTVFRIIASNLPDPEPPAPPETGAYSNAYSNAYN